MADPSTGKRTARVPVLMDNGRLSDDYLPQAVIDSTNVAEQAATAAIASASAAAQSASDAAKAAQSVADDTDAAKESAESAASSASTAQQAATTATDQAGIATTKAGEAAQSASDAAASLAQLDTQVADAQAAATEAKSAQTAAEAAQTAAETASGTATTKAGEAEASAQTASTAATTATEKAEAAQQSADTATAKATEAATSADAASASATSAAQSADTASAAAEKAASVEAGNVPHIERTGTVIFTDDVWPSKPIGVTVHGKTRQNLWVNPSGNNAGVTATNNDDGSITISGTSTTDNYLGYKRVYSLKPSTKYTLSCSSKLPTGCSFRIQTLDSDGGTINYNKALISSLYTDPITFTTESNCASCYIFLYVTNGSTASGTYRVMLNEGDTSEPWCPPGLNSVSEASLVTAGKNLWKNPVFSDGGITATSNPDGGLTLTGISTDSEFGEKLTFIPELHAGNYTLSVSGNTDVIVFIQAKINGSTTTLTTTKTDAKKITVKDGYTDFRCGVQITEGTEVNETIFVQLELGSTATAYEPPNVTTTPIDLQGNELSGIGDIKDHISLGSGIITKKLGLFEGFSTGDGSGLGTSLQDGFFRMNFDRNVAKQNIEYLAICDKLPYMYAEYTGYEHFFVSGESNQICFVVKATDKQSALDRLAEISPKVIAVLNEEETIQLTPTELPQLPAPNLTAWADTDVETDISLDHVRDVSIVIDKLEQAVAVAQAGINLLEVANG